MTLGSRIRWSAALLTIAVVAGCHSVPIARIAPSPNRPQSTLATTGRASLMPATLAMEPPSEMSSIEPVSATGTTEPSPSRLEIPGTDPIARAAPTPLLDAALVKAKEVEAMAAAEMAAPPVPPVSASSPKLETVALAVPAGPTPAPEKPAEPPARPEEVWRDGIRKLGSLARARLEQAGGPGSPWGLRTRIMAWLAEPEIDPDLDQQEADGIRAVLRALDDVPVATPRKGDDVRAAVLVLEDRAPLEIVDLRLCSKVERFGDYEAFDPPVRKAGQEVVIYCEVDGLRYEPTAAGFRTRLAAHVEIVPQSGGPAVWTHPMGSSEEVCRRRRRDYFIAAKMILPRDLPPGDYRLRLTERDLTADRSATREVAFAISKD